MNFKKRLAPLDALPVADPHLRDHARNGCGQIGGHFERFDPPDDLLGLDRRADFDGFFGRVKYAHAGRRNHNRFGRRDFGRRAGRGNSRGFGAVLFERRGGRSHGDEPGLALERQALAVASHERDFAQIGLRKQLRDFAHSFGGKLHEKTFY